MNQPKLVESHSSKTTPQYKFHMGIKEFCNDGREATKQELYKNLLRMDAVTMVKPENLEKELYLNALTYLMFLREKRMGKIKAQSCADAIPQ